MTVLRHKHNRGITFVFINFFKWFFSINKWANPYSKNSSSCIGLIFTNQPNLSVISGVHSSLHLNCHHQIVHTSFNLDIYYPSRYQRLIWDYKKADPTNIREALDSVNWERLFGSFMNEQNYKIKNWKKKQKKNDTSNISKTVGLKVILCLLNL